MIKRKLLTEAMERTVESKVLSVRAVREYCPVLCWIYGVSEFRRWMFYLIFWHILFMLFLQLSEQVKLALIFRLRVDVQPHSCLAHGIYLCKRSVTSAQVIHAQFTL